MRTPHVRCLRSHGRLTVWMRVYRWGRHPETRWVFGYFSNEPYCKRCGWLR